MNSLVTLTLNSRQRIEIRKSGRGYIAEYYSLDAWYERTFPDSVPVIVKTETISGGLRAVKREVKRSLDHGFTAVWS